MDIFIIVILLILSALLSASETSLTDVNRSRLRELADDGSKRAKMAIKITDDFDKTQAAILLLDTVANLSVTVIAAVYTVRTYGEDYLPAGVALMILAVVLVGEVLPKGIAGEVSLKLCLLTAYPLNILSNLLFPVTWVLLLLKRSVLRLFGDKNEEPAVTERDLIDIIDEIEDEGVMDEAETDLVKSAVEFGDITVNDILIPRVNIFALDVTSTVEEVKDAFLKTNYSRIPLYKDTVDNIVGIIHEKNFYKLYLSGRRDFRSIIRKPTYIFELTSISDILEVMQKSKTHMAVVVDQYGGTQGIVTLEDIIEELVGEIYDETDEEDHSCVKIGENEYEVTADMSIRDFLDFIDLPDHEIETECTSIGGLIMEELDHIPEVGEVVECDILKITVCMADEQRIDRVKILVAPPADRDEESEEKE